MPTCPNGHQSGSDDWCEVCGHRMTGAVPPPPPPPPVFGGGPAGPPGPPGPPPAPGRGFGNDPEATFQAELCPQCRTPREARAPFCEECRYNFLTNTATSYTPLAPRPQPGRPGGPGPGTGATPPPGFPSPQRPPQMDPFEYRGSRPSQMNRPAEPLTSDPSAPSPRSVPSAPSAPSAPSMPSSPSAPQGPPPPPAFQQPGPAAPPAFQQPGPAAPPAFQQPGPAAPPAFQQPGPAAPPAFQQQPPQTDDDWMLSPPQPQAPLGWSVTIGPDREYFMAMMQRSGPDAAGLNLPAYSPEQRRPLTGNQVTIGRRRHSTGESPDIDLSVPPEDPGVSHKHAMLVQQPDGFWAVVDQNSTNGTTVNSGEDPIQPFVPVPLQDGDRVHVGAWTTITIRRG
ncbi:hypothetical protein GCM10020367_23360 [Streptomyces sannanensis]|uniref:FHA domain-containing protein n=1 Tax=Streptomyces sannanensis TaxID=285536 RepID=A0ABP6S9Z3_9ACTN